MSTLHCKQTQTNLKNYNSGLGFCLPQRKLLSDPLRNRNPCLGRDPCYGPNRTPLQRGVKCAAQTKAAVPAGMARKTKLSPSAEVLKSTPLVQLSAVNCRQLCQLALQNKKDCSVTTQLSLYSNLKQKYVTAFRHKLIHNSITQSKASKSGMAANGGNVPHLQAIITSHTVCTFKMIFCTMHAATVQQL